MLTKKKTGFTVVEILIVIAVIGILAALSIVGYKGVTTRAEDSKTQSNLSKAQEFIESQVLSNGLYPSSLNGFSADNGITLSYVPSSDFKTYCLSAVSSKSNTKSYKAIQESTLTEGTCVEPPFDGPTDDFHAWTCVPTDPYAPDPRPYSTIAFNVESKTIYPKLNINVYIYDSTGSLINQVTTRNEINYLSTAGQFNYGLGNGYPDASEFEIEAEYIKPNGSVSSTTNIVVPNNVANQPNCSGYTE